MLLQTRISCKLQTEWVLWRYQSGEVRHRPYGFPQDLALLRQLEYYSDVQSPPEHAGGHPFPAAVPQHFVPLGVALRAVELADLFDYLQSSLKELLENDSKKYLED
jgi:hypothetical protein